MKQKMNECGPIAKGTRETIIKRLRRVYTKKKVFLNGVAEGIEVMRRAIDIKRSRVLAVCVWFGDRALAPCEFWDMPPPIDAPASLDKSGGPKTSGSQWYI